MPTRRSFITGALATGLISQAEAAAIGDLPRDIDGSVTLEPSSSVAPPVGLALTIGDTPEWHDTLFGMVDGPGDDGLPGFGTPPYFYQYGYTLPGGSYQQASDPLVCTSQIFAFRTLPPATSGIKLQCDIFDNLGTKRTVIATGATPAYRTKPRLQLSPPAGRSGYTYRTTDAVGTVIATASVTGVPGPITWGPIANQGHEKFGTGNNRPPYNPPDLAMSGNNVTIATVHYNSGATYSAPGAIIYTFCFTDATGKMWTYNVCLNIVRPQAIAASALPVYGGGDCPAFCNNTGTLVMALDEPVGDFVRVLSYHCLYLSNAAGNINVWPEILNNPGNAFEVEGNGVLSFGDGTEYFIARTQALPPAGNYTLTVGTSPYAPFAGNFWKANNIYTVGDLVLYNDSTHGLMLAQVIAATGASARIPTQGLSGATEPNFPAQGGTVGDNVLTWKVVIKLPQETIYTGAPMGLFLPSEFNIALKVVNSSTGDLSIAYNNTIPLDSAMLPGSNVAKVNSSGFTPTDYDLVPLRLNFGHYWFDVTQAGQIYTKNYSAMSLSQAAAPVRITATVPAGTTTISSWAWASDLQSETPNGAGYSTTVGAPGDAIFGHPAIPTNAMISSPGASPTFNFTMTQATTASIPSGTILFAAGTPGAPTRHVRGCIVRASNAATGQVASIRVPIFVAWPRNSTFNSYTIGQPPPAGCTYRTDTIENLIIDIRTAERIGFELSLTRPASAGATIYCPYGAGQTPDGSYAIYQANWSGRGGSETMIPLRLIGIPGLDGHGNKRMPLLTAEAPEGTNSGYYLPKGFIGQNTDLFIQLFEISNGTVGESAFNKSGSNFDGIYLNNNQGSLDTDCIYAHNIDCMTQRGAYVNECVITNAASYVFGTASQSLPGETYYEDGSFCTRCNVFACGNNGADILKTRAVGSAYKNIAAIAGNEGSASGTLCVPTGGMTYAHDVFLHQGPNWANPLMEKLYNESYKQQKLDNVIRIGGKTVIVIDSQTSTYKTGLSSPPTALSTSWFGNGRGSEALNIINDLTYWNGPVSTYARNYLGINVPAPFGTAADNFTSNGTTPLPSPLPQASVRPDLSRYWRAPAIFAAMGLTLDPPPPSYQGRGGSVNGPWGANLPIGPLLQDITLEPRGPTVVPVMPGGAPLTQGEEVRIPAGGGAGTGLVQIAQLRFLAGAFSGQGSTDVISNFNMSQGTIGVTSILTQLADIANGGNRFGTTYNPGVTLSQLAAPSMPWAGGTTHITASVGGSSSATFNLPAPSKGVWGGGAAMLITLTSMSWVSGVVTAVYNLTASQQQLVPGDIVDVTACKPTALNGRFTITSATLSGTVLTVKYNLAANPGTITRNGFIFRWNAVKMTGVLPSQVTWQLMDQNTTSGAKPFSVTSGGGLFYDRSRSSGETGYIAVQANLWGQSTVFMPKYYGGIVFF